VVGIGEQARLRQLELGEDPPGREHLEVLVEVARVGFDGLLCVAASSKWNPMQSPSPNWVRA
jgi:hypothetical protein